MMDHFDESALIDSFINMLGDSLGDMRAEEDDNFIAEVFAAEDPGMVAYEAATFLASAENAVSFLDKLLSKNEIGKGLDNTQKAQALLATAQSAMKLQAKAARRLSVAVERLAGVSEEEFRARNEQAKKDAQGKVLEQLVAAGCPEDKATELAEALKSGNKETFKEVIQAMAGGRSSGQ